MLRGVVGLSGDTGTGSGGSATAAFAVVTPRWKLAYYPEQGEGRLFDRAVDPHEQTDLYNQSGHPNATQGVRDRLLLALLRWRALQLPLRFLHANRIGAPAAAGARGWFGGGRGAAADADSVRGEQYVEGAVRVFAIAKQPGWAEYDVEALDAAGGGWLQGKATVTVSNGKAAAGS